MRKGISSLCGVVHEKMRSDVRNGDVFIFIGSSRRLMKLLHAEDGGMVMYVNVPSRQNKNRMLRDIAHLKTSDESVSDILLSAGDSVKLDYLVKKTVKDSTESFRVQKSNLENIHHVIKKDNKYYKLKNYSYSLVETHQLFGLKIFIMRDFLIMFSFIAMFMGIFIQLIILGDNKQMTEL